MRYLAFDIECCDGQHICEFGYVLTNEKFNLIEKDVLIINPDKPFNLGNGRRPGDIKLFFSEATYYSRACFPHFYERIKRLLTAKDQIVIGHAVSNDAGFIRRACKRYDLPPINFAYLDSQRAYAFYTVSKDRLSLERVADALEVEKTEILHRSDEDALLTLRIVKGLCEKLSVDVEGLKGLYPSAIGYSRNFDIRYCSSSITDTLSTLIKNPEALSKNQRALCLKRFVEKVKPSGEIIRSRLTGRKLCFGVEFERTRVKDTYVLIRLLADHGCGYSTNVFEDDYFVATDEELNTPDLKGHTRYYAAKTACKIISFAELYSMLGVDEKQVEEAPFPTLKSEENAFEEGETPEKDPPSSEISPKSKETDSKSKR